MTPLTYRQEKDGRWSVRGLDANIATVEAMEDTEEVFDWLAAQVTPDGMVTLTGSVTQPTLRNDAEFRIKRLESASGVVNKIEVRFAIFFLSSLVLIGLIFRAAILVL